jgi:hypothetical protein
MLTALGTNYRQFLEMKRVLHFLKFLSNIQQLCQTVERWEQKVMPVMMPSIKENEHNRRQWTQSLNRDINYIFVCHDANATPLKESIVHIKNA